MYSENPFEIDQNKPLETESAAVAAEGGETINSAAAKDAGSETVSDRPVQNPAEPAMAAPAENAGTETGNNAPVQRSVSAPAGHPADQNGGAYNTAFRTERPGGYSVPYGNPGQSPYQNQSRTGYGTGYGQNTGAYGQSASPYGANQYGQRANPYGQNTGAQRPGNAYGYQPPQNPNPMSGYNVKPAGAKKKSGGKRIVALAIVCALIGGLGGGAAVGMALRGNNAGSAGSTIAESVEESKTSDAAPSKSETAVDSKTTVSDAADNINTTVIDVKTNSTANVMTPQDVYDQYVNAVVAISNTGISTNIWGQYTQTASSGSGFIISEDGYIITNNHVVKGAQELKVIMTSGEEYEATIIGADAENDVALIKIDAKNLPTVAIGKSESIQVGQQVCAIGNPLGELTNTLTVGYVSALDREINENGTPINMFQTDCAINSGNSGGPLFDMNGNVVGITTAKYSNNSSYSASIEGIGFCIPIDDAMDIVSDLLEYGYVKGRPSLGINCQAISSTVTQYYNLPTGVYVTAVGSGTAADHAGLQEGDIITAIDGTEIKSVTALKTKLKDYAAGDTATLSIYRTETNETMELSITFDEKEATPTSNEIQIPDTDGGMS